MDSGVGLVRRVLGWLGQPDPPLEDESQPLTVRDKSVRSLYLGRSVQAWLRFEGGDPLRAAVLGVPALESFADVAALLGIDERRLVWLCYQPDDHGVDHYHRFVIPKRNGEQRPISAPKADMRTAQRVIQREILAKIPVHDAATAYRPGASIVANAGHHTGQAVVIRLDIADFFPTISRKRVKGMFASFGYSEGVAAVLALLTTDTPRDQTGTTSPLLGRRDRVLYDDADACLPQGACTSPAIANVICGRLDARLTGLARKRGFTYTRYADDMTFSHPAADAPVGRLISSAVHILGAEGFAPNASKARVTRAHQRQIVTGLLVNNGVAVPRADLRRFRAILHSAERDGFEQASQTLGKDVVAYARGYIAYIQMVDPANAARIRERHPWVMQSDQ
ncbi:MAG TPA: reverse transcriptase family protein [Thermomicrobiales bacterium]|nr:reverse transcriptase family protein [Thermomicrobiales bacterium]